MLSRWRWQAWITYRHAGIRRATMSRAYLFATSTRGCFFSRAIEQLTEGIAGFPALGRAQALPAGRVQTEDGTEGHHLAVRLVQHRQRRVLDRATGGAGHNDAVFMHVVDCGAPVRIRDAERLEVVHVGELQHLLLEQQRR